MRNFITILKKRVKFTRTSYRRTNTDLINRWNHKTNQGPTFYKRKESAANQNTYKDSLSKLIFRLESTIILKSAQYNCLTTILHTWTTHRGWRLNFICLRLIFSTLFRYQTVLRGTKCLRGCSRPQYRLKNGDNAQRHLNIKSM
jgi:hypothetical protein